MLINQMGVSSMKVFFEGPVAEAYHEFEKDMRLIGASEIRVHVFISEDTGVQSHDHLEITYSVDNKGFKISMGHNPSSLESWKVNFDIALKAARKI